MKLYSEKWNRDNRGARRIEHDLDANIFNLRFADDILLVSGSHKHTKTMWDDFITATITHGLQLPPTKRTIISQHDARSPKQQHGDSARDELRNLATRKGGQISWPEHHLQKATKTKFEHRIRCAWPDFTSHRQELTTTKFPWKSMLKRFDITVAPSLFYASGT